MKKEIALVTPVSKDLLYVKIADAIQNYIKVNDLKPGARIPSERALSEQLGTGRHSVREALRVLENRGIIEVRMGAGTFVSEETHENSLYLEFVKVNYMEMLNIKTELEKYAVKLAMYRLQPEKIAQLAGYLAMMETAAAEQDEFSYDVDKAFHKILIEGSGNKMLAQMIEKMIETFDTYYSVLPQNKQLCIETIPYHRKLMDAIRSKDKEMVDRIYDEIRDIDANLVYSSGQNQKQ